MIFNRITNFIIQDETIVGSVYTKYIQLFQDVILEGQLRLISDFEVWKALDNYKISSHRFTLRFNDLTKFALIDESSISVSLEKIHFLTYEEFRELSNTNLQFNGLLI